MLRIATDRLILRPVEISDAEVIFYMHLHPEVSRFLEKPAASLEDATRRVQRHIEVYYAKHGYGLLATVLKETGKLVGWCGYLPRELDGMAETEVAYRLAREFWGRGYATEAASALVRHAFSELRLPRVVALIHPDNVRSVRVAERVGLAYEREIAFFGQQVGLYARNAA